MTCFLGPKGGSGKTNYNNYHFEVDSAFSSLKNEIMSNTQYKFQKIVFHFQRMAKTVTIYNPAHKLPATGLTNQTRKYPICQKHILRRCSSSA